MKLLTELYETVEPLITEATAGAGKQYTIEGVFLQANVRNRNGRVYPLNVLEREVARYNENFVQQNRALGELGHPDSPAINLDRVSHMIVRLECNGSDFVGKAKIMNTPYGNIVKAFIDDGVKFGVSSRGVGSLRTESNGQTVVGEDFHLATAADIVADPSAPEAFVSGLRESREWVWENGVIKPAEMERLAEQVKKSNGSARKIETLVFERFMTRLTKGIEII